MTAPLQNSLPEFVIDFLSDVDAVRFAKEFVKVYGLKIEDIPLVMVLAEDVVYGDVTIGELPAEMISRLGIDPSKSKQSAIEMAKRRLLPVQQVINENVTRQIQIWAGELSALEVSNDPGAITPMAFVHQALVKMAVQLPDHVQVRLETLLEAYVSGRTSRELTVEHMMRSSKVGGMDYGADEAKKVLDFIDEKKVGVRFVDMSAAVVKKVEVVVEIKIPPPAKEGLGEVLTNSEVRPPPDPLLVKVGEDSVKNTGASIDVFSEEDRKEIEKIKTDKQAALEVPSNGLITVEQMARSICEHPSFVFEDKSMTDRCRQIVELRLRDVRNPSETQKQLEYPIVSGGLGIVGRRLADMMEMIEKGMDGLQAVVKEKIDQERASYVKQKQAVHLETKDKELGVKEESNMDVKKVQLATKEVKQPLPAPVSTIKTKVADVQFTKRLSGPIDELHRMTLIDFRRLSKDPVVAIGKIKDQVDLLQDQGFQKRVEAIRGWQTSPLYRMYLKITQTSLMEGSPLEDVRMTFEKTGEETLTKQELSAIMKLNTELRF